MTSENALKRLKKGNKNYASGKPFILSVDANLRKKLFKNKHRPYAIIVSCSDSRVPIEIVFNAGPGELFVIRTAGNVVGNLELGSLEYAVEELEASLIVVVGHQGCGAVHAAAAGKGFSPALEAILKEIRCSCRKQELDKCCIDEIEDKNILHTIEKIAADERISKAISAGKVKLQAAKYSMETGIVNFFN